MTGPGDALAASLLAYNLGVERARQAYREGQIDWDRLEADEAEAQKWGSTLGSTDQARAPSPSSPGVSRSASVLTLNGDAEAEPVTPNGAPS